MVLLRQSCRTPLSHSSSVAYRLPPRRSLAPFGLGERPGLCRLMLILRHGRSRAFDASHQTGEASTPFSRLGALGLLHPIGIYRLPYRAQYSIFIHPLVNNSREMAIAFPAQFPVLVFSAAAR